MPEDPVPVKAGPATATVQRKCAACEEEDDKRVQRSPTAEAPGEAPPIVHEVLSRPGRPLPTSTRQFSVKSTSGGLLFNQAVTVK